MLDALPLSGLGALDDGLAEESAHLLDSEITTATAMEKVRYQVAISH